MDPKDKEKYDSTQVLQARLATLVENGDHSNEVKGRDSELMTAQADVISDHLGPHYEVSIRDHGQFIRTVVRIRPGTPYDPDVRSQGTS